ncbi:TRAP transporter small permease subunit [Campylobacter mucosalis]|uniref:TRAP transporter small permease subunit n=1 Tax=Campylobacter mucosalis TaxID=202 RepID=UPI00146FF277|nr:TRAP transporter small permease subunit [Campylobacter mucosalis]
MLTSVERFFDLVSKFICFVCMCVMALLVLDVFFNVIARYFFKYGNVAFQELEWHFFAIIFLLGMNYALNDDAHVRVDIFYAKFSPKTKSLVNMFGALFFIVPFAILVCYLSIDYVAEAYTSGEGSNDPGGLSNRWIIKAFIPASFFLLIFFALNFFVKNLRTYIEAKRVK